MNKYDKRHIANVRGYQRRIDNIYKKAVEQISMRSAGLDAPDGYIFTFDDFPALRMQIDALIAKMQSDIEFTVTDGVRAEWDLANAKNDALVGTLPDALSGLAKYHRTHEDALSAFLGRKQGGLGLSENVWKYATQFKDEIEMGLDVGIRDGLDAASMARQLKQYLKFPDMLFRRVRDEHGVLHLSQRAAAFHPGQGVYRSSYKNARRLAATETNMAYRTSDHERWQDLDFVVGIEIHLSNNHTCINNNGKPVPFFDICDELQGKYPKEFKFVGWHPHCRCIATPIMKTKAELDADDERLKRGEEPSDPHDSENAVTDMPDGWKQWMEDNSERLENAKSMPYFITDNEKLINGTTILPDIEKSLTAQEINQNRQIAPMPQRFETINDVEDYLNKVGTDWIAGVENGKFNFNHTPESKLPAAGETDGLGNIFLTGQKQIVSAFDKIAKGLVEEITVGETRSIQTLWHEITHCRNIHVMPHDLSVSARKYMETANEYVSRKTFGEFMSRLGTNIIPHPELLISDAQNGYNTWVTGFENFVNSFGLDQNKVFLSVKEHLFNDNYKTLKNGLFQALEDGGLTTIDGKMLSAKQKTLLLETILKGFKPSWVEGVANEFGLKVLI